MQLRKEDWKKFRTSTGFEPVTSRLPVRWDWDCYKEQEKNKPITDKRVTSNDPRDNCEKHFDSSSLLVSKQQQNNNFARASHLFVHFFPVFARLRRENA